MDDFELQNFARELHEMYRKARRRGDSDFGVDADFKTRSELIAFLENLMFTVAIQHSILNYADLEFHGQVFIWL